MVVVDPNADKSAADLRRRLSEVASSLRAEFSSVLKEPQAAKEAGQYFARLLWPNHKAGRPRRADVTEALRLESQGVSRQQIYRRLGKNTKDEQHALREAMRMRKYRQRKRDKLEAVTPT